MLLSLLILAPVVFAEEVAFTFRDINTRENISDVVVYVVSPKQIMQYVEPNGRLSLNISPGTEMTVLIDDTATKGQDYFATHSVQQGRVVSVFPIGTVRGIVKDALDNVVSRADLKFDCRPVQGIVFPEKTDKFGSFFVEAVPEGTCKIYATYSNGIGTRIVEIERGDLKDIEIRLDKTLVSVPVMPAYGTRLVSPEGKPVYCDVDSVFKPQKPLGESCQNNYECLSNSCADQQCISVEERIQAVEKELKEQRGILQKIMDFFKRLFGG